MRNSKLPAGYLKILGALKEKIQQARLRAALSVNAQLLNLYWEIGNTIKQQEQREGWGAKTVERLSGDLRTEFPDMKGLSPRNLRYMRDFAVAYPHFPYLQAPPAKSSGQSVTAAIVQPVVAKSRAGKVPFWHLRRSRFCEDSFRTANVLKHL